MATFDDAIGVVLANEGGYVCDPDDPGGETKYGICKRSYPDVDIKNLTKFDAANIYRRDFWKPIYSQIDSQKIATKVFDMAVNMGSHQSHVLLQKAIRQNWIEIVVDGVFGPKTLQFVNQLQPETLLNDIREEARKFYVALAEKRPSSQKFLAGWLKRAEQ